MVEDNLVIENATLLFRNFAGREGVYNKKGEMNFCVIIPDVDKAQELAEDGWNIRILSPREEGDPVRHYISVKVSFEHFPPNVWLITRKGKQKLDETSVEMLDYAELRTVDLIIRPYNWEHNGKSGVKAYLKTGYFTLEEDEFAEKYAD